MCESELTQYMDQEMQYLNERINLLRLFKAGNIGFRDVFFHYSFTMMGFIKNTINHCSHNQTRNTIASEQLDLCQYFGHKKLKVHADFFNSSSS
ncbi:hypothetical protein D7Y06_22455, partial [Roseburia sp. 1XD42-69]